VQESRQLAVVVFLALAAVAVIFGARFDQHPQFGFVRDASVVRIQDFASNRQFAQSWWTGGAARHTGTSPYTVEAHLATIREWTGSDVSRALPFIYPPTMLLLLGPFSPLPAAWAFGAWSLLGAAAAAWILSRQRRHRAAVFVALVSPVTLATIVLGQTALLTTAALLLVMDDRARRRLAVPVLALVVLTIKPPLALTAAVALLVGGRSGVVAIATAIGLLIAAAFTAVAGPAWPLDYVRMVTEYNRTDVHPAFAIGLAPEAMTNLRAALHATLGIDDRTASLVSAGLWLVAVVAIVLGAWRRRLDAPGVWASLVAAYLLLCPHVSHTEDVALLLVLGAFPASEHTGVRRALALAVVAASCASPAFGLFPAARVPVVLGLKVVVAVLVARLAWQERPAAVAVDEPELLPLDLAASRAARPRADASFAEPISLA
jgi:hypothetical protein